MADNTRVTIPATWCVPVPGVVIAPQDGGARVEHMVVSVDAGWVRLGRANTVGVDECRVPLDVPANLLGVLRAVWAKVTGEEAPALLVLSGMSPWHWRLSGPRGPGRRPCVLFFGEGEPVSSRQHVIPALDGVTDPLKAAAIIAEAVLGGEA